MGGWVGEGGVFGDIKNRRRTFEHLQREKEKSEM